MTFPTAEPPVPTAGNPAEIIAVRDASQRNLLLAPEPLIVKRTDAATVRVEVGSKGPWLIRVSADQHWLQFDRPTLEPDAAGAAELRLAVLSEGTEEFAVLRLGWAANGEDYAEHILIWRQSAPRAPDPTAATNPVADPAAAPSTGTTPLPDWLKSS
jgi:hypothetical protein